jgi:hypothetical protein
MLALAWQTRAWRELGGQLLRLFLVPLGHAVGRLPRGNPGSSRVNAFKPVSESPEISEVLTRVRAGLVRSPAKID